LFGRVIALDEEDGLQLAQAAAAGEKHPAVVSGGLISPHPAHAPAVLDVYAPHPEFPGELAEHDVAVQPLGLLFGGACGRQVGQRAGCRQFRRRRDRLFGPVLGLVFGHGPRI